MQRTSALISLLLFMIILSWVGLNFQQEPPPLRDGYSGYFHKNEPRKNEDKLPERLFLPDRNSETEPDAEGLEYPPEGFPFTEDGRPLNPFPAVEDHDGTLPEGADSIHFLLLGRAADDIAVDLIMIVSLIPGSHSRLTAIAPGIEVPFDGAGCAVERILERGGDYGDLYRAVEEISGLSPQFYIELNLNGFIEMVDLLGGIDYEAGTAISGGDQAARTGAGHLDGAMTLALITGDQLDTGEKENLVVNLLIAASDVENTRLGLTLLWTGFKNIRTNLTLSDLIDLRRVSHTISPNRVTLREIFPEG